MLQEFRFGVKKYMIMLVWALTWKCLSWKHFTDKTTRLAYLLRPNWSGLLGYCRLLTVYSSGFGITWAAKKGFLPETSNRWHWINKAYMWFVDASMSSKCHEKPTIPFWPSQRKIYFFHFCVLKLCHWVQNYLKHRYLNTLLNVLAWVEYIKRNCKVGASSSLILSQAYV